MGLIRTNMKIAHQAVPMIKAYRRPWGQSDLHRPSRTHPPPVLFPGCGTHSQLIALISP